MRSVIVNRRLSARSCYAYFATVPKSERVTHRWKNFAPQISVNVRNTCMQKNLYVPLRTSGTLAIAGKRWS